MNALLGALVQTHLVLQGCIELGSFCNFATTSINWISKKKIACVQ